MAAIDLHSKPFDEPTITKLEIFEDYTEAWLPTFIMQKRSVCIFDFFAGTGYDKNGVPGSPIRILNQIQQHRGNIFKNEVEIKLYLNEYDESKYNLLSGVRKSKIRSFQDGVKFRILNGDIKNNFELYDHVIAEGHVPSHAVECVKQMKKNGEVFYDNNSPLANYENVYKIKRKLDYRLKQEK